MTAKKSKVVVTGISQKCIVAGCGEPVFENGTCCKKHFGKKGES